MYRERWMRLLIWSRRYSCETCGQKFVILFGRLKLRLT